MLVDAKADGSGVRERFEALSFIRSLPVWMSLSAGTGFNPGMDNTPLVRAIVEALMFLEHADDDEIDPDVAMRGIEGIRHELDALSDVDRAEFRLVLDRIAETSGDSGHAQRAREVPFMLWGGE
ncbi:hypothetical protein [Saccharothrix luteola]|uniref:hypothetical protein n=1 Tax=Saccharothrix luteola TaxID=2893018 RepID=UPI001E30A061|nr:hypothetical protein [Saccharothrix luteola]MCC8245483.1 hypothetical protein [Saccharothrix luteola]